MLVGQSGLLPWQTGQAPPGLGKTFAPFWEAWRLVKGRYVDQASASNVTMMRGAIAGMLASLGDTGHTTYLTPQEVQRMKESLAGNFEGIGATITMHGKQPTIMQTIPGSPARKSGLKPGDILLEVGGKPTAGLSLEQLVSRVRGPAGTVVDLRVLHQGETSPVNVQVTRAKVVIDEVAWSMLPGNVALLGIREFGSKTDEQLRAALKDAREQGARALIIDVRGNPGGLKTQAVAVTSEFLKNGQVVFIQENARGVQEKVLANDGGRAGDLPVCVLIDGGTASSAEIFSGALKDNGRAKLVGTRTFGTGTVLEPFPLSDGSEILLAVAKWLTPDGHEIWHKGITPDVEVKLPPRATPLVPETGQAVSEKAFRKSDDAQVHKAFDLLREQLGNKKP
jgi:carboxyl-terminal processing protease